MSTDTGVHVCHCCNRHGCKYGDEDCPVALGKLAQDYPCEFCYVDEAEDEAREINALFSARDAELASLRLRYREAVKALAGIVNAADDTGGRVRFFSEARARVGAILSTPEAIAIIKEGQS